jgi:protein-arginine kinase activator protein McsA
MGVAAKYDHREALFLYELENGNNVMRKHTQSNKKVKCSICGRSFQQHSKFERFCSGCKEDSDIYYYWEGL